MCVAVVVLRAPRIVKLLRVQDAKAVIPQDVQSHSRAVAHERMKELIRRHRTLLKMAQQAFINAEDVDVLLEECKVRFLEMLRLALTYDRATWPHSMFDSVHFVTSKHDVGKELA